VTERDPSAPRGVTIYVVGTPAPQGSKRFVGHAKSGRGVLVESSKRVKPWRNDVVEAALAQVPREMRGLAGPLTMTVVFHLRAPVSASKKKLSLGPCRKPDLSKLVRSTEDALSDAGIWGDDAQVVECLARKRYAEDGEPTGAFIYVRMEE